MADPDWEWDAKALTQQVEEVRALHARSWRRSDTTYLDDMSLLPSSIVRNWRSTESCGKGSSRYKSVPNNSVRC